MKIRPEKTRYFDLCHNVHKTGESLNDFCQLYNLKHLENDLLVTKLIEAVNIDHPKY